jgi:hypothetical protein
MYRYLDVLPSDVSRSELDSLIALDSFLKRAKRDAPGNE